MLARDPGQLHRPAVLPEREPHPAHRLGHIRDRRAPGMREHNLRLHHRALQAVQAVQHPLVHAPIHAAREQPHARLLGVTQHRSRRVRRKQSLRASRLCQCFQLLLGNIRTAPGSHNNPRGAIDLLGQHLSNSHLRAAIPGQERPGVVHGQRLDRHTPGLHVERLQVEPHAPPRVVLPLAHHKLVPAAVVRGIARPHHAVARLRRIEHVNVEPLPELQHRPHLPVANPPKLEPGTPPRVPQLVHLREGSQHARALPHAKARHQVVRLPLTGRLVLPDVTERHILDLRLHHGQARHQHRRRLPLAQILHLPAPPDHRAHHFVRAQHAVVHRVNAGSCVRRLDPNRVLF